MAVTIPVRRSAPARRRMSYLTIRVSGVLLAVLALGHYAVTHIVNDVADTGSAFIEQRWATTLWVAWDGLLLGTALLHAASGLSIMVRDYRTGRRSRARWVAAIAGSALALFLLGVATLTYSALGDR